MYAYVPFKRGVSIFMVSVVFPLFLPVANPEASCLLMHKQIDDYHILFSLY